MSFLASAVLAASLIVQPTDADKIPVFLDGRAASAQAFEGPDGVSMRLAEALQLMTGGKAKAAVKSSLAQITWEGKLWLTIPVAGENDAPAGSVTLFDPPGSQSKTSVPMDRLPWLDKGTTMVDLEALGRLLRVWVDLDRSGVKVTSTGAWLSRLGVKDPDILSKWRNSITAVQDFGVSPPGRTLRAFVRPESESWVQVYKMLPGETPQETLGVNLSDGRPTLLTGELGRPAMRKTPAKEPVFVEYSAFNSSIGHESYYIGVVSRVRVDDPIAAIKSGALHPGNTAVVGVSQRFTNLPFEIERAEVKSGETLGALAARLKMTPELVAAFNGLDDDPRKRLPSSVKNILTIGGMKPESPESECTPLGWVAVMPGQSLKEMADQWKVTEEQIIQFNPILRTVPIEPGLPLVKIGLRTEFTSKVIESEEKDYVLKVNSQLKKYPHPAAPTLKELGAGAVFPTLHAARPNENGSKVWAFGEFDGVSGYIPIESLEPIAARELSAEARPAPPAGPLTPQSPLAITASGPMIPPPASPPIGPPVMTMARNAVQYIGTPYKFGGSSLTKGIDCSHFVWRVRTSAGLPCPPPPVSSMETVGRIVDQGARYPGRMVERGSRWVSSDNAPRDRSLMRIGDRMITHQTKGWKWHTMLYLGKITYKGRKYTHAMAHSSGSRGIGLEDFTPNHRYQRIYAYTVRDGR